MKIRSFVAAAKIGFIILLAQGLAAEAAEVKVIAGVAMSAVWEELAPQFERATGHKLVIWYGNTGTIRRRIEAGEAFDLAMFGKTSLDEYTKQGKIVAGTRTGIARVGMGVGARAGAPKPDISSVDAFKRALLNAKSVTYNPEGAVSIHLVRVAATKATLLGMSAKLPGSRVLEGRFSTTGIGMAVPKGRAASAAYVGRFVEDAKSEGLVKAAIERAELRGVTVDALTGAALNTGRRLPVDGMESVSCAWLMSQ